MIGKIRMAILSWLGVPSPMRTWYGRTRAQPPRIDGVRCATCKHFERYKPHEDGECCCLVPFWAAQRVVLVKADEGETCYKWEPTEEE